MDDDEPEFLPHHDALGRIINLVEVTPLTERQRRPIVCSPVPGRDGVEYVPDWFGLTKFG